MGQHAEVVNSRAGWDSYAALAGTGECKMKVKVFGRQKFKRIKECLDSSAAAQSTCSADDSGVSRKAETLPAKISALGVKPILPNAGLDNSCRFGAAVGLHDKIRQPLTETRHTVRFPNSTPEQRQDERQLTCCECFEVVIEIDNTPCRQPTS